MFFVWMLQQEWWSWCPCGQSWIKAAASESNSENLAALFGLPLPDLENCVKMCLFRPVKQISLFKCQRLLFSWEKLISLPKLFWKGPCWMPEQDNTNQATVLAPSHLPELISLFSTRAPLFHLGIHPACPGFHVPCSAQQLVPSRVVGSLLVLCDCQEIVLHDVLGSLVSG